jgi:hypothetical protein
MEQPGEPAGGTSRHEVRIPAYPCREAGGIILTYMGPGDPPLLPIYEVLTGPREFRSAVKVF